MRPKPSAWPVLLLLAVAACRPEAPTSLPLDTGVCVRTTHHTVPVPHTSVYVKYNVDTFPGYDQPPGYYDAVFTTGADGRGCLAPLPEGEHWVVAFGYDSLYFPHDVYGSLRVTIDADSRPKVDTTMSVSE